MTNTEEPGSWTFHAADLKDPAEATAAVDDGVATHGRLDVRVNNTGGSPPADTVTASPRFTEQIVALNLLSARHCSKAAHDHLLDPAVQ